VLILVAVYPFSISPTLGPIAGRTNVTLSGNLTQSASAKVQFYGAAIVTPTFAGGTYTADSPPVTGAQTVAVGFALNGVDYVNQTGPDFLYYCTIV